MKLSGRSLGRAGFDRLVQFLLVGLFGLCSSSSLAQTVLISPKDSAIIQLRNGKGELHLILRTDAKTTIFEFRILDRLDKAIPGYDWSDINFKQQSIDTILWLPLVQDLTLQWRTNGRLEGGLLTHIEIGHLFAIAGQSNAQGWSPQPYVGLSCDARMLWNDYAWHPAEDPTGGKWGSPWIAFVNQFSRLVHDSLPIGIINTAAGGSGLTLRTSEGQWLRNGEIHDDTNTIYGAALTRIRGAGADVEALFWIQGESDVLGTTVDLYQSAYATLHKEFEEDLGFPVRMFHLQIGGQTNNPGKVAWGIVREALRTLPNSTLVGTSVGLPLADDIHYSAATARDVGERFAGAVASGLYGVNSSLYPPPLPAPMAKLVECVADDPKTGWKIELECLKGGKPCKLSSSGAVYGFQLTHDASRFDTSQVFAIIDPHDASKIDIFLRFHSISPDPTWRLSYAIYGDVTNISLNDGVAGPSGLPNMLVSFLDLPVFDSAFAAAVADHSRLFEASLLPLAPNPSRTTIVLSLKLGKSSQVNLEVLDLLGQEMRTVHEGQLASGDHELVLDCSRFAAGTYIVLVQTDFGTLVRKIMVQR